MENWAKDILQKKIYSIASQCEPVTWEPHIFSGKNYQIFALENLQGNRYKV